MLDFSVAASTVLQMTTAGRQLCSSMCWKNETAAQKQQQRCFCSCPPICYTYRPASKTPLGGLPNFFQCAHMCRRNSSRRMAPPLTVRKLYSLVTCRCFCATDVLTVIILICFGHIIPILIVSSSFSSRLFFGYFFP